MELIFNTRWWDYSDKRFNINGRICLETAIPFGLGGIMIMYVVNPFLTSLLNHLSEKSIIIIGLICVTIYLIDNILSLLIILKFKREATKKNRDSTAEINNYTIDYLMKSSHFIKRLILSFPNLKIKEKVNRYNKNKKISNDNLNKAGKNSKSKIKNQSNRKEK